MKRGTFWAVWGGSLAVVSSACVYVVFALQHRFGGYDLSPLIDSGWRILSGQVPNRDFICTFPPLLYFSAAAAFRIFGIRWISLSIVSALFTFAITLLGQRALLLLKTRLGECHVLGLSLAYSALQLLPFLFVGHPWHSSWTQALALYAIATTFALGKLAEDGNQAIAVELQIHLVVADTLLLLSKPNIAVPVILFCTLALLMVRGIAFKAFIPLAVALVLSSLALATVHTSLPATFHVYRGLTGRMVPAQLFEGVFVNTTVADRLPLILVYLTVLPAGLWTIAVAGRHFLHRQSTWIDVLSVSACLLTVIGWGTNAEHKLVDAPCMLFGAAILGAAAVHGTRSLQGAFWFSLYFLLGVATFYSAARARMQSVGEWGRDNCGLPLAEHHDRFFGTFHNCAPFFSLLDEVDAAVAAHPGAHIFFGPRMEFLYARERIASPKGMPLWWHPGSSYPESDQTAVVGSWRKNHFDVLVFLHDDRTRMPKEILDTIANEYDEVTIQVAPNVAGEVLRPEGQIDVYLLRAPGMAH